MPNHGKHFVDLDGVLSHLHADDELQAKPPSTHGKEASVHHTLAILLLFFKATQALNFFIICNNESEGPEVPRHFLLPMTIAWGGAELHRARQTVATLPHAAQQG